MFAFWEAPMLVLHRFIFRIVVCIDLEVDLGGFGGFKSIILGVEFGMMFAYRFKSGPRAAKRAPRAAKSRPRGRQELPKSGQEGPKSSQESPKSGPRTPPRAKTGPDDSLLLHYFVQFV